jgi:hypothetical protein
VGIAASAVITGCTLGVVDLDLDPSPAEMAITSEYAVDPADPSKVQVVVSASLDPGVGPERAPRRLTSDLLFVEGVEHPPSQTGDAPPYTWRAAVPFAAPGPEGVGVTLPRLEGLGLTQSFNMRVRSDLTPGNTVVLAEGEDLVLTAASPSRPAETLEWSLELTSSSLPGFRLTMGGAEAWPEEVRVPADQLPAGGFPFEAALRIQWVRSLTLFELTATERYDAALRSIILAVWTVERAT